MSESEHDRHEEPAPAEAAAAGSGSPAAAPSPGALVRQARERAGLALEDVSGQTNLSRGTLDALEKDDFALLSEPVYIRGYYRKLAKVLPVTEAELLEAYRARAEPKAAPMPQRIPLAGGVDAGASPRYRGQGIGIVVAVVVILGLLFLLSDNVPSNRSRKVTAPPTAAAPAPRTEPQDEPAPDVAPSALEAPPAATSPPGTAAPEPTPPPRSETPVPAPQQLVLEFGQSSFVRVEDARNRTLAIGLVRSGERQVLNGQPPYTVFLGNARQVKVLYGGKAVDFSSHITPDNETARFTVP